MQLLWKNANSDFNSFALGHTDVIVIITYLAYFNVVNFFILSWHLATEIMKIVSRQLLTIKLHLAVEIMSFRVNQKRVPGLRTSRGGNGVVPSPLQFPLFPPLLPPPAIPPFHLIPPPSPCSLPCHPLGHQLQQFRSVANWFVFYTHFTSLCEESCSKEMLT